jgi:hypothetical protein
MVNKGKIFEESFGGFKKKSYLCKRKKERVEIWDLVAIAKVG